MIPCLALAGKATAILPGTDAVSLSRSEPTFPAAIPVHGQAAVFPSKLGDSTAEQGFNPNNRVKKGKKEKATPVALQQVDLSEAGPVPSTKSLSRRPKAPKSKKSDQEDKTWIPAILDSMTFAIEVDRLFLPMAVINLRHTWLLLIRDGMVEAALPYWGRYSAPNLSIDHPLVVEIEGVATDYRIDPMRKGYEVNFKVAQVGENLEIELRINKNGYVTFYLYSSMRSDILYSGEIKMVPDKSIPFQQMSDQLW